MPSPDAISPRVRRLGWALLAAAGFAVAVGGLIGFVDATQRTDGWDETIGTVIQVHDSGTTISFQDSDGCSFSFRSEYGWSSSSEGDRVTVEYPPRNPQQAQTSADVSAGVVGWAAVGAVVLVVAMLATWQASRSAKGS